MIFYILKYFKCFCKISFIVFCYGNSHPVIINPLTPFFISISTSWVLGFGTIVSFNIGSNVKIFGLTIFEFIDYLTSNLLLPIGGILISVIVGWCISRNTLENDRLIGENLLSFIWFISIKFIAPLAVLVIMLNAIGLKIF